MRKFYCAVIAFFVCVALVVTIPSGPKAQEAQSPEEEAAIFLIGNVAFIMFHEVGHALVDLYDIPVLGREEDAVDNFATLLMVDNNGDPVADQMALSAAEGWLISHQASEESGYEPQWSDSHGVDMQRFYSVVCLLYASAPDFYKELADEVDLPEDRRAGCEAEYEQLSITWNKLLEPFSQKEGQPVTGSDTFVSYSPSEEFFDEINILKEMQILEIVAEEIRAGFVLPQPITFSAQSCGEENAYWDPENNKIIMCYELVRYYMSLLDER